MLVAEPVIVVANSTGWIGAPRACSHRQSIALRAGSGRRRRFAARRPSRRRSGRRRRPRRRPDCRKVRAPSSRCGSGAPSASAARARRSPPAASTKCAAFARVRRPLGRVPVASSQSISSATAVRLDDQSRGACARVEASLRRPAPMGSSSQHRLLRVGRAAYAAVAQVRQPRTLRAIGAARSRGARHRAAGHRCSRSAPSSTARSTGGAPCLEPRRHRRLVEAVEPEAVAPEARVAPACESSTSSSPSSSRRRSGPAGCRSPCPSSAAPPTPDRAADTPPLRACGTRPNCAAALLDEQDAQPGVREDFGRRSAAAPVPTITTSNCASAGSVDASRRAPPIPGAGPR